MATSRTVILGLFLLMGLSTAQAHAADGWGASWSFGPVRPTASNHIIYTKTTLVPGRLASTSSSTGPLFIWPGLSNPSSDLVQTTADAWQDNASACGAKAGQWCLEASVFGGFGQRSGPSVAIDPDDHITIEYQLGSDNNTWTQTVTSMKLGRVVSTLTSTSGLMLGGGFGFATEADADSYTIDVQYYLCTEIHLAAADPQFGSTGSGAAGAKYGATGTGSGPGSAKNLRTPDGGLTWLVDLITLPAMNPQGTQSPVPSYNCGTGGTAGTGGVSGVAGTAGTSGASSNGGAASTVRRSSSIGGTGAISTGGTSNTGGIGTGGRKSGTGGVAATTGGRATSGGSTAAGGTHLAGGMPATGGATPIGGRVAIGGNSPAGGSLATSGILGPGGSNGVTVANSGGPNTASPQAAGGASSAKRSGSLGGNSLAASGDTGVSSGSDSPGSSGGCSCTVAGDGESTSGVLAFGLCSLLVHLRRRRR